MDADRLAEVAAQLAGRIREDDPEANARWLLAITDEADRWGLLFVLAAMVPDDRPMSELTAWHTGTALERRRETFRAASKRYRDGRAA